MLSSVPVCRLKELDQFEPSPHYLGYLGPAHAVYFATYEAVKHLMGGNRAGVHHPLAAGRSRPQLRPVCPLNH